MSCAIGRDAFHLSSAELNEWIAYELLTGRVTGQRQDYQFAMLTHIVAATMGSYKGSPEDWLPRFEPVVMSEEQAIAQQKAFFNSLMTT